MGKPESPRPGRRGLVERVRLRWAKEVHKESWCELEEEEMSEKEREEKDEEWKEEGSREEIEKKNKD